jgi:molecular chaperone GrpE
VNDAEPKPSSEAAEVKPGEPRVAENPEAPEGVPATEGVDPLRAELDMAKEEAARLKDQLLRTAADFDNFRKRARKDVEDAQKKGLERALLEILPVSDNLERAIQAAGGAKDVGAIVEGVRMVLKMTEDALSRLGVERVSSVGQAFDPGLHEAVQQIESDAPAGTVVLEMVPGYRLGGKLLRAAMVAVARPKATGEANGKGESQGN